MLPDPPPKRLHIPLGIQLSNPVSNAFAYCLLSVKGAGQPATNSVALLKLSTLIRDDHVVPLSAMESVAVNA